MSRSRSRSTPILAVILLSPLAVFYGSPAPRKVTTYTVVPGRAVRPFWPWANEEWKRSDTDFVRIRREVDAFLQGTASLPNRKDLVLARLKQLTQNAQENPHSSQALFRLAYTTYQGRKLDVRPDANGRDIYEMYGPLESAHPGGSYQYDRMIYIIFSCITDSKPTKPLGKRLLKRNPEDIEVKYFLTRVLSTGTPEEQALALTYAQQFQRQHPERPRAQSLLGLVYEDRWNRRHKAEDVDKAIVAYRKYLSMIPPTNSTYHDISHLVQVLEREKVQHIR